MLLCSQEGGQSSEGAAGWSLDMVWEKHTAALLAGYQSRSDMPGSILHCFLLGLNSCLPK